MKKPEEIIAASRAAFSSTDSRPRMTLRGGDAVDGYAEPPDFDPALDEPTDDYLEKFHWGVTYLDPESWRFYFPTLSDYAVRHCSDGSSMVIDALLSSLRPPEKDPPRFSVLTPEQEGAIVDFLDFMAFSEESDFKEDAMQVLEEYWTPNALYRPKTEPGEGGNSE